VVAGRGRGHMSPGDSRGEAEKGAVIFLRHEIDKNFVSSVKAGMGREESSACTFKCH